MATATLTRWVYREMASKVQAALTVAATEGFSPSPRQRGIAQGVRAVSEALKAENHRFRYDHFYAACGLNEWGYVHGDPESPLFVAKRKVQS